MIREKYRLMDTVVGSGGGGGKGGTGSSGRTAVEASDTLSSIAKIGLIDLLGEGAIGGLVDGGRSIEINGTPLMNAGGGYNLNNVAWEERKGTPNQDVIAGFSSGIESPHTVDVALTQASPYTFTVSNVEVDRVRIIMDILSLMSQDTTTGDIFGSSVAYHFEVSTDGGTTFAQLGRSVNIKGKTKSKYQRSTVITLPRTKSNGQPVTLGWQIRVIRETPDSASIAVSNSTRVNSYVEIVDAKLNYANSALVYISLDPTSFSSIPSRAYYVDGLLIQVPNNYNALTNTYTGVWNGGFQLLPSSNPAWILYDLLTNRRYGLGRRISPSQVDRAMLYTIGRYCDEMVSNGLGGTEKRFSINTQITQRVEAYKLIADIASVFRGMVYWNGGMACFKHDAPESPGATFTHANVKGGEFHYASSSRKDRHSVINVTWNDPSSGYKQRVQPVEDRELIATMGIVKEDVVAFGCISRGQAARVGRWMLYSEAYESNFITFTAGLDASLLLPGEVIRICDAVRAGKRMADRVTSSTLTSVTTDLPVDLAPGNVTIYIAMPDGSFAQRTLTLTSGGTGLKTFSWTTPLPELPVKNAVFALSDSTVEPMLARIVSVKQSDKFPSEFVVTATQHNPSKYAAIESGAALEQPKTSVQQPYTAYISTMQISESTYFIAPGVIGSKLHVSWEGKANIFRLSYRITQNGSSSNWYVNEMSVPSYDIEALNKNAIVDIKVEAFSADGEWVSPVIGSATIMGKSEAPNPPTNLVATSSYGSVSLTWTNPSDIDLLTINVYMSATNNSATAVKIGSVFGDSFVFSADDTLTRYFWVTSVNKSKIESGFNAVPGASATPKTFEANSWSLSGITFSVNEATNTVSWTGGTILKNATQTHIIGAGSATWSGQKLYVYFNPLTAPIISGSTKALQTTNVLATAVSADAYPLATYDGGAISNLKGGDGTGFFSGSQLLVGTVGAAQLVAGDAIITGSAQIADAVIETVHIKTKLSATIIEATELSVITENVGTITAGVMRSVDGSFVIDLNNKYISIL
jgi:predicted phage tail protein